MATEEIINHKEGFVIKIKTDNFGHKDFVVSRKGLAINVFGEKVEENPFKGQKKRQNFVRRFALPSDTIIPSVRVHFNNYHEIIIRGARHRFNENEIPVNINVLEEHEDFLKILPVHTSVFEKNSADDNKSTLSSRKCSLSSNKPLKAEKSKPSLTPHESRKNSVASTKPKHDVHALQYNNDFHSTDFRSSVDLQQSPKLGKAEKDGKVKKDKDGKEKDKSKDKKDKKDKEGKDKEKSKDKKDKKDKDKGDKEEKKSKEGKEKRDKESKHKKDDDVDGVILVEDFSQSRSEYKEPKHDSHDNDQCPIIVRPAGAHVNYGEGDDKPTTLITRNDDLNHIPLHHRPNQVDYYSRGHGSYDH